MTSNSKGFSLIQFVLTILLVSIVTYVGFNGLSQNSDAARYEATRSQLAALQVAILGDAKKTKPTRQASAMSADWGSLPVALSSLMTAQTPAWAFNSVNGIGGGWNGPYVTGLTSANVSKDAWKRALVYTTAAGHDHQLRVGWCRRRKLLRHGSRTQYSTLNGRPLSTEDS